MLVKFILILVITYPTGNTTSYIKNQTLNGQFNTPAECYNYGEKLATMIGSALNPTRILIGCYTREELKKQLEIWRRKR